MTLQPLAALQHIQVRQNAFSETGAGALNLTSRSIHTSSLRGFLGGRVFWEKHTRRLGHIRPGLQARWMHEFLDTSGVLAARYGVPGSPVFTPRGLDQGRDWALVGAGLTILPRENLSLYLSYDIQANDRQAFHTGSGGMQFVW